MEVVKPPETIEQWLEALAQQATLLHQQSKILMDDVKQLQALVRRLVGELE